MTSATKVEEIYQALYPILYPVEQQDLALQKQHVDIVRALASMVWLEFKKDSALVIDDVEQKNAELELSQLLQEDFNRLVIENLYVLNKTIRRIDVLEQSELFYKIETKIKNLKELFDKYKGPTK